MTVELEVLLHGRTIGILTEDEHGQKMLRFSDAYRKLRDRPVLGQKFEDDLTRSYRGKDRSLPPFFANLIPEQDGELRPILESSLGVAKDDDLALLESLGRDLPGAVEVRRLSAILPSATSEDDSSIEPTMPRDEEGEWLRFSLAGVQLKFSVVLAENKVTLPAHGRLGDWLVKLDSRRFPHLCENEYSVMLWARESGFDVPDCLLVDASSLVGKIADHAEPDTYALVVRRYDRRLGVKVHQEDFAQVVNLLPRYKYDHVSYEQLAKLTEVIVGADARDEMIRRFVFMMASGNADAHLKNWSLVYPDHIHAALSPLYDQVATVAWPDLARRLALRFARSKDMSNLTRDSLARFVQLGHFHQDCDERGVLRLVDDTLQKITNAWAFVSQAPAWAMPPTHMAALREHWQRTPLLRDSPLARL